jgi:hypothetical protein
MRELYKDTDTVADINKKRLEWTGHVVRMDQGRSYLRVNRREVQGEDLDQMAGRCREESMGDEG